ncbi:MAG: hypothetical protein S0880_05005 [Actinomycetota bacterium]|nr:hypothetical protein [Actinomycetota bacterium]
MSNERAETAGGERALLLLANLLTTGELPEGDRAAPVSSGGAALLRRIDRRLYLHAFPGQPELTWEPGPEMRPDAPRARAHGIVIRWPDRLVRYAVAPRRNGTPAADGAKQRLRGDTAYDLVLLGSETTPGQRAGVGTMRRGLSWYHLDELLRATAVTHPTEADRIDEVIACLREEQLVDTDDEPAVSHDGAPALPPTWLADAIEVGRATAADGRVRALDVPLLTKPQARAAEAEVRATLDELPTGPMVEVWCWRCSFASRALTRSGKHTGIELRFTRRDQRQPHPFGSRER